MPLITLQPTLRWLLRVADTYEVSVLQTDAIGLGQQTPRVECGVPAREVDVAGDVDLISARQLSAAFEMKAPQWGC